MVPFLDLIEDLLNGWGDGDRIKTTCESEISDYVFYQFCLLPAAILTLLFASTTTRRGLLTSWMGGRPGLLYPMDTLTRHSRISYCCAFGATAFLVYEILMRQKYAIQYDGPVTLTPLVVILTMFVYGIVFFPMFACLALRSAFSFGLGSLYVWMFMIIDVYQMTECADLTPEGRMVMLARYLPRLGCLAYLSVSLPIRFVASCYRKQFFKGPDKNTWESLKDIKGSYQGLHVRKLLKPPEPIEEPKTILEIAKTSAMDFLHSWIYHWHPGFRYPSRLLSVLFVSFCVIYMITVELLSQFVDLFDRTFKGLAKNIDAIGWHKKPDEDPNVTAARDSLLNQYHITYIAEVCALVSITGACLFTILNILHMMSSFRSNLFAMYRGDFRMIPSTSETNAVSLCTGSIKYAGYQVAYIVWAFILMWLILLIFSLILAWTFDGNVEWLVKEINNIWVGVVVAVVLMIVQKLVAKYVLLQGDGEHLRLDNRHSYFIFAYFMFFYNIFLGLVSCLVRILKAIAIGSFFLARLDSSTLPRKFEYFDPGLNAYIGYIHMEAAHTHPVVNVFIRLLASLCQERKNKSLDVYVDTNLRIEATNGHRTMGYQRGSQHTTVKVSAKFKWFVVYTLLHNPQVRIYRKGYVQVLKKARREGLRVPISDKPISPFDIVQLQRDREDRRSISPMSSRRSSGASSIAVGRGGYNVPSSVTSSRNIPVPRQMDGVVDFGVDSENSLSLTGSFGFSNRSYGTCSDYQGNRAHSDGAETTALPVDV